MNFEDCGHSERVFKILLGIIQDTWVEHYDLTLQMFLRGLMLSVLGARNFIRW